MPSRSVGSALARRGALRRVLTMVLAVMLLGIVPGTAAAEDPPCTLGPGTVSGNNSYVTPCPTGVTVDEATEWHPGRTDSIPQYFTGAVDWGRTITAHTTCIGSQIKWYVYEANVYPNNDFNDPGGRVITPADQTTLSIKIRSSLGNGFWNMVVEAVCEPNHQGGGNIIIRFEGNSNPPLPNQTPSARFACPPAAASADPGNFNFVSTSSDQEDGTTLNEQWAFGDGGTAAGRTTTHQYTSPGTFTARLTVTDSGGKSATATCDVTVAAPPLSVTLSLVDHASHGLNPDEEVEVRVHDTAGTGVGALSSLTFDAPALQLVPDDGTLTILSSPTIPDDFDLAPDSSRDFDFTVKATGHGRAELSARVTGEDAAAAAVDATSPSFTLNVQALLVELSLDPAEIDLDENDDGAVPEEVTLTVKVTNTTDTPIDDVTILPDLLITPRSHTPPAQDSLVELSGPTADGDLGTLAPGAANAQTRTFVLKAQDDGKVRIQATVEATDPDGGPTPLRSIGQTDVDITAGTLLYLETVLTGAGGGRERTVNSGDGVLVTGFIQNRSNDQKIVLDPLFPVRTGPLGNGNPVPLWRLIASGPQGACTIPLQGTLQPGEKIEFQALVQSYIDDGTRGTIDYQPAGSVIDDEGIETPIEAGQIRVKANTLPFTLHLDDGNPLAEDASDLAVATYRFTKGFVTEAPQWFTSFFSTLVDSPRLLGELTGKGLVGMVQAADWLSNYAMGVYNDPGGLENLSVRVSNDIAEATGKTVAEVKPGVDAAIQGWFQPFFTAYEAGDYATAFDLLGQVSADAALEVATCYAKLPEAARFVELAEHIKETGIATRLSDGLRALKAGDVIPFGELGRLFGIAPEQGAALTALAQQKGLLITTRFRQAKSIEWIRDFLAVLKPERIKVKSVEEIDHLFLGYKSRFEGSVVLKRPLDLSDARVTELYALRTSNPAALDAALDAELSRFAGEYAGATDELKKAARARLSGRIKEWASPDAGYAQDLLRLRDEGRIQVPWNYRDNFLPGTDGLPGTFTERSFGLTTIEGEADHWIVQMGDRSGTLRQVTGDIDIVGIQKANGKGLTPAERVEIYRILQETTGMQHPETATWIGPNGEVIFRTKADLLAAHAPGGEPLVQFSPDGQARAVFISPELSYFNTATGDAHLWYQGGYRQPKPTVFRFGESDSVGVYFPDKPVPTMVPYVVPGHWVLDGTQGGNWQDGSMGSCTVSFGNGPGSGVITQDGQGGLRQYTPTNPIGTWQIYDTSKCLNGGGSAPRSTGSVDGNRTLAVAPATHILLLPQSVLTSGTAAGATELVVADLHATDPGLFTGPESEFQVGQRVVINPGGPTEERATISALGSLIVDAPLQFSHALGELVAALPSGPPSTTIETGPTSPTKQTIAVFSLSSDTSTATFECRLDGAAVYTACAAAPSYSALSDGDHVLRARAVFAGNVDPTPATWSWRVDTVPPTIAITSPAANTAYGRGDTVASAFACLDLSGSGVATCTGPAALDTTTRGPKAFVVTATDKAGNLASRIVPYRVVEPGCTSCRLLVSGSPARSNAIALDGRSVRGRIYIFVSPDSSIREVTFSLDSGLYTRTDPRAPWDPVGVGTIALPLPSTLLARGWHGLVASVRLSDGSIRTLTARFSVTQ